MFRINRFPTGHENTVITTDLLPKCAINLRYEFLLRYMDKDSRHAMLPLNDAIKLCDAFLSQAPNNNFFHYARAFLAYEKELQSKTKPDFSQTRSYLFKAIYSDQCVPDVAASAAAAMSKLFFSLDKVVEGHAWRAKAIIMGCENSHKEFLNTTIKNNEKAVKIEFVKKYFPNENITNEMLSNTKKILLLCEFFAIIATVKNKFPLLNRTPLFNLFTANLQDELTTIYHCANLMESSIHVFEKPESKSTEILLRILNSNPKIFLECLEYCDKQGILNSATYETMLNAVMSIVEIKKVDPRHKEVILAEIARQKFLFLLNSRQIQCAFYGLEGKNYFQLLNLRHLTIASFERVPNDCRDYVLYEIFKKLFAEKMLEQCVVFLNAIQDTRYLDSTIFDYFAVSNPGDLNFALFEIKRNTLRNIDFDAKKNQLPASHFLTRCEIELRLVNNPLTEIRARLHGVIQRYLTYDEHRSQRSLGLFKTGVKERSALKIRAEQLSKEAIFTEDYKKFIERKGALGECLKRVEAFVSDCETLEGKHSELAIHEMNAEINTLRSLINDKNLSAWIVEMREFLDYKQAFLQQPVNYLPITQPQWFFVPFEPTLPLPPSATFVPVAADLPPSYEEAVLQSAPVVNTYQYQTGVNPLYHTQGFYAGALPLFAQPHNPVTGNPSATIPDKRYMP